MAAFQIRVTEEAATEIAELPAFVRKQVVKAIETQLLHQPDVETKNRKRLRGLIPPWEHLDPLGRFAWASIAFSMIWTKPLP